MTTTIEYLNAVKSKTGAVSDYALAPKIGLSKQMISRYRLKKDFLSDEVALKVASILEVDPAIVLISVHAERAKNEPEKRAWTALFERLGGKVALISKNTTTAPVLATSDAASYNTGDSVYLCKIKK